MWFAAWSDLVRVLLVGSAAYVCLVIVLRVSGKRTLAKLNAFDLVVTVALGSTLATILLSSDVSLAEGAMVLILLAALQYLAATVSSRWPRGRTVLTALPTVLVDHGTVSEAALARSSGSAPPRFIKRSAPPAPATSAGLRPWCSRPTAA